MKNGQRGKYANNRQNQIAKRRAAAIKGWETRRRKECQTPKRVPTSSKVNKSDQIFSQYDVIYGQTDLVDNYTPDEWNIICSVFDTGQMYFHQWIGSCGTLNEAQNFVQCFTGQNRNDQLFQQLITRGMQYHKQYIQWWSKVENRISPVTLTLINMGEFCITFEDDAKTMSSVCGLVLHETKGIAYCGLPSYGITQTVLDLRKKYNVNIIHQEK